MQVTHFLGNDAKLPYKDFEFITASLDYILNTFDDRDFVYYIVCDFDYNDILKEQSIYQRRHSDER